VGEKGGYILNKLFCTQKPLLKICRCYAHDCFFARKNLYGKMMEKEKERVERLKKRLEHWAEHNKEHASSFTKAAKEAEELGLTDVSECLRKAVESMDESTLYLIEALNGLISMMPGDTGMKR
jgi:hypothetical protein